MSDIQKVTQNPQVVRFAGAGPQGPQGGPPQGESGGMTAKDVMQIIRKRLWLIIIPTVLLLIVSIAGTALWLKLGPLYTANAFLGVNPPAAGPMDSRVRLPSTDIIERLVATQAQMVSSEPVLRDAVERIQRGGQSQWFRENPATAIDRLESALSVSPVPNTDIIRVSVTCHYKDESPELATAVARAFVQDVVDNAKETNSGAIESLEEKLEDLKSRLADLRQRKRSLQGDLQLADLQARGGVVMAKLQSLNRKLIELRLEKADAQAALDNLKEQAEGGELASSPQVRDQINFDQQVRAVRQTEMNLSVERDNALRKFGPEHREVLNIETRLNSVQEKIKQREEEVIQMTSKALIDAAQSNWQNITAQQMEVQTAYNEAKGRMREIEGAVNSISSVEQEQEIVESDIRRIQARLTELQLSSQNERPVFLRRSAQIPKGPSTPKWTIMIPAGLMLGLLIGFGLAFLLEFMDTSIKNPADIARRTDLPVLGMVPHTNDLEEDIPDIRNAFQQENAALLDEAFRQVRTCLLFSAPIEHRRTVLVTSPLPEDGRTTVTMNLAASIARGGRKVLVIDTNFRQPVVSRMFCDATDDTDGLSSVLVGRSNWQDLVKPLETNLDVIPAGQLPPSPAELLGSDKMKTALDEMSNEYDQVLLDGAPILVVTDAPILSTLTDGVIMVARAGSNTHGILQRAKGSLNRVNARILGVVLNGVRVTAGGYLRENYDTFYNYHERATLPPAEQKV